MEEIGIRELKPRASELVRAVKERRARYLITLRLLSKSRRLSGGGRATPARAMPSPWKSAAFRNSRRSPWMTARPT